MLKKLIIIFIALFFLAVPGVAGAENNKIGIHILETSEIGKASKLVNSSGGDWGYVTVVLRDDDFEREKWQRFFDDCRRKHVIPMVRIATHIQKGNWVKPEEGDLDKWPKFLNSLNWPVKKQLVILFNEPNHAQEWGGEINPSEYALFIDKLIKLFRDKNPDFYLLGAGFDQAADGAKGTMGEGFFLQKMAAEVPGIYNQLDGWASHSYPNHGFKGLPGDSGRATIRGYQWELDYLKALGLNKDLPVFITETGWPHSEGIIRKAFYGQEKTAGFIEEAFKIWEKDDKIRAVTPFILNYPEVPFDHFSWLDKEGRPYKQYERILKLGKKKGEPEQNESFRIIKIELGEILPTNYQTKGKVRIKNTGQWIMGERKDVNINIMIDNRGKEAGSEGCLHIESPRLTSGYTLEPGEEAELEFILETGTRSAEYRLMAGGKEQELYVFRPFDLKNKKVSIWKQILTKIKLWWIDFREK